jgi:hypothetical protein
MNLKTFKEIKSIIICNGHDMYNIVIDKVYRLENKAVYSGTHKFNQGSAVYVKDQSYADLKETLNRWVVATVLITKR